MTIQEEFDEKFDAYAAYCLQMERDRKIGPDEDDEDDEEELPENA